MPSVFYGDARPNESFSADMGQQSARDRLLGTSSRVSEVLNGKRELSLTMVRRLRERFNISADLLISHGTAKRAGRRMAA